MKLHCKFFENLMFQNVSKIKMADDVAMKSNAAGSKRLTIKPFEMLIFKDNRF